MQRTPFQFPLPIALWLVGKKKDYVSDFEKIGVTTILKSPRQIILGRRVGSAVDIENLDGYIPSTLGNAVHDSIDNAIRSEDTDWGALGLTRDKFCINTEEEGKTSIYSEYELEKTFGDIVVRGRIDWAMNKYLTDYKAIGTFKYVKDMVDDYILQCSIYKNISNGLIGGDKFSIAYIFTDWSKLDVIKKRHNYPISRVVNKEYEFLPDDYVNMYIEERLDLIRQFKDSPEEELPLCTGKDLFVNEYIFKVYKDINATRALRVFRNADINKARSEALGYAGLCGGMVVEKTEKAKGCTYCSGNTLCSKRII